MRTVLTTLLMFGSVWLPYNGFCLAKLEFLSDEDTINAAIEYGTCLSGRQTEYPVWIDFSHQLFGMAVKSVLVRYKVNSITESGFASSTDAVAQRAVGGCGHVLNTGR